MSCAYSLCIYICMYLSFLYTIKNKVKKNVVYDHYTLTQITNIPKINIDSNRISNNIFCNVTNNTEILCKNRSL